MKTTNLCFPCAFVGVPLVVAVVLYKRLLAGKPIRDTLRDLRSLRVNLQYIYDGLAERRETVARDDFVR